MVPTPETHYSYCKNLVERHLRKIIPIQQPRSLYHPCRYILNGGGKRLRPLLTLLSCEAVGGKALDALHAGTAIEILHNFTLVHDDIMDHAPSRRGRATVHTKWDENTAILTGDALLAIAYRELLQTRSPHIQRIIEVFTGGVITVCEGQALDKEFENRSRVHVNEYIQMIEKKTGKLVAIAAEIGALIACAPTTHIEALKAYGAFVGRAFQLQDDMLDIVGNEKKLGKAVGGDLQEGKRTFLLLEAMRRAKGKQRKALEQVFARKIKRNQVAEFRTIYEETGAIAAARTRIHDDIEAAIKQLAVLPDSLARQTLLWLTEKLLHRTS